MKHLLTNPILLKMMVVIVAAGISFVVGKLLMRHLRRSIAEEAILREPLSPCDEIPLYMYHAVIQELKQQKYELQNLQQVERRRAKTSDNISAAILSNLSSGVLFFAANGLVRQTNAAAKQILGFASPVGMTAAELFRTSTNRSPIADAIEAVLHGQLSKQHAGADYLTPGGDLRTLDVTVSVVRTPAGEVLGVACLVNDRTEMTQIQRQIDLRGEVSGEMAFELRNSLATISGYAQQLAASRDADLARQLAADIAAESAHLDRTIGGFLVGGRAARAASGA